MPQVLTPAIDVASLEAGTQLVVWQSGSQYRVDVPGLIDFAQLGLGTAGQTLAMNAAGTAIEWQGPWAIYTPTYTGFGTVVTSSMFWRLNGDTLLIQGKFTSAISTAVEARLSLPAGLVSSASKVPNIREAGTVIRAVNTTNQYYSLIESNVGYMTFGNQSAASHGLTKINGSAFVNSGDVVSLLATIPV